MKPSGPGVFLLEGFLLQFQFLCLWLVCSEFLFPPSSVLEGYTFLRICLFLPSCPFCCHIVAHGSVMIFCISVLSVMISQFSFLILLIWFFSLFFLMSLANGLSILFIFSKNHLFVYLCNNLRSRLSGGIWHSLEKFRLLQQGYKGRYYWFLVCRG